MEDNKRFIFALIGLFIILVMLLCSGCKTIKEVPVEVVKTKIEYIDRMKVDSIYSRDSIYIHDAGDTITIYKDKIIYKYEFLRDTAFICQTDTVEKAVEVKKKLSKYEELKMQAGGVAIPFVFILICCGVGYFIKKFVC